MKECAYKKDGICEISKNLQFLSKLKDEDLICNITEKEYKLCPSYKEGE